MLLLGISRQSHLYLNGRFHAYRNYTGAKASLTGKYFIIVDSSTRFTIEARQFSGPSLSASVF